MADQKLGTLWYDVEFRYKGGGGNGAPMGGGGGLPSAQNISAPNVMMAAYDRISGLGPPTMAEMAGLLPGRGPSAAIANSAYGGGGGMRGGGSNWMSQAVMGFPMLAMSTMFPLWEATSVTRSIDDARHQMGMARSTSAMLRAQAQGLAGATSGPLGSTIGYFIGSDAARRSIETAAYASDVAQELIQGRAELTAGSEARSAYQSNAMNPDEIRSIRVGLAKANGALDVQRKMLYAKINDIRKVLDALDEKDPDYRTKLTMNLGLWAQAEGEMLGAESQKDINSADSAYREKISYGTQRAQTARSRAMSGIYARTAAQGYTSAYDTMSSMMAGIDEQIEILGVGNQTDASRAKIGELEALKKSIYSGFHADARMRRKVASAIFSRNPFAADQAQLERQLDVMSATPEERALAMGSLAQDKADSLANIRLQAGTELRASQVAMSSQVAAGVVRSTGSYLLKAQTLMQQDPTSNYSAARDTLQAGINNLMAMQRSILASGRAVSTDNPFAVDFSGTATPREDSTAILRSIDQGIKDLGMKIDAL